MIKKNIAQPVVAPLTRAAIFLVATINPGADNRRTVRSLCGDSAALLRAVESRDLEGGLSCVVGFGSDAWDKLFGPPRPAQLRIPKIATLPYACGVRLSVRLS